IDKDTLQSQITFPAIGGTAYRIAVDGFAGDSGNIKLNLTLTNIAPRLQAQVLSNNGFGFQFSGVPGRTNYAIEVSTNLVNWTTLTNIQSTNLVIQFNVPVDTNFKQRFFRAVAVDALTGIRIGTITRLGNGAASFSFD